MKKLLLAAGLAAILSAPAFAAKVGVEFTRDDGTVLNAVFNDETMMASSDAGEAPYTLDSETKQLCSVDTEGEFCVTFAELPEEAAVGFSTTYESTRGHSGTAVIKSVE